MLRVSIRELLLITAFVGVCLVSLKYANELLVLIISNGVLLALMIATVVAFVDRGRPQAMACGIASCVAIYVVLFTGPSESRLVTTKLLNQLHKVMVTHTWYNRETGEEIPPDPRWLIEGPPFGSNIGENLLPDSGYFNQVGHWLLAILLGYLGSRFAGWLYARRPKEEARTPKP